LRIAVVRSEVTTLLRLAHLQLRDQALTVLEFKPETDSLAGKFPIDSDTYTVLIDVTGKAHILELGRSSLARKQRKTSHGTEDRTSKSTVSPGKPFEAQEEDTAVFQSRIRIAELEEEVKILERKLLVAKKGTF
jgi:hypothetical protein